MSVPVPEAITLALQLSQAATTIISQVKEAQSKGATEVDTDFDASLLELAAEINRRSRE